MAVFQHKYEKVLSTTVIIDFAINALNECGGHAVACVLMNDAEVAVFHHEVSSTNTIPADRLAILDDPASFWADRKGKLWLMTYSQLSLDLAVADARPTGDLTLLLHMGCGQYTWDMVQTCHHLWLWAQDFDGPSEGPIIWVYTISNLKQSIYCDVPATYLSTSGTGKGGTKKGPQIEWQKPDAFAAAIAQLHADDAPHRELCKTLSGSREGPAESPMRANRAVLFTPEGKLLETFRQLDLEPLSYVQLKGDMDEGNLRQWTALLAHRAPRCDPKIIVVGTDVGVIGTVRHLGVVLVVPFRAGVCMDPRVSQVVFRDDIPMSQAEMRYACRVACDPRNRGSSHVVSMFTTKDEFDKLAEAPLDPMAFTADLPAVLLLLCRYSYFDSASTPPIRLPGDNRMIAEHLRRLELRGLTEGHGGPPTQLGENTAWWHDLGGCRNFDVANLLALAQVSQGGRASALVQIAAVLLHPNSPLGSPLASLLTFHGQDLSGAIEALNTKDVDGFAEGFVKRGPIWIAIAIWSKQRETIDQSEMRPRGHLSRCDGMLDVSHEALALVQDNWKALGETWADLPGAAPLVDRPSISDVDFLYLEECMVRVWMHKLVLVCVAAAEMDAFGYDLASGHPIRRPPGDAVDWGKLTEDKDADRFYGMGFIGVFAVYTALHRSTGHDGQIIYIPETLTYVSGRAVRHVLRDVAASKTRAGQPPPSWEDLLRTRCPFREEPDAETT